MNGNDFLKTLSQEAINLMEHFLYIENPKPCEIIITEDISNPGFINPLNDKNVIVINPTILKNNTETTFLHEYIHAKQMDLNFPHVIARNQNNEYDIDLCNSINSFVLDLNVNFYLSMFGFKIDSTEPYTYFKELLKPENKCVKNNNHIASTVYFAQKIAMFKLDGYDIADMLKDAIIINPQIVNTYNIFIKGSHLYHCQTRQSVHKLFKYLLKNLKISDIVMLA